MISVPKNIIISRTDSIGDVILTLPIAKALKAKYPEMTVAFMGKKYTQPVIEACRYVDVFLDVDDFMNGSAMINGKQPEAILHVFPVSKIAVKAKQLRIPLRIGTTNRLYHWTTCNKLVSLSRKNSTLHEAQLNLKLLAPLGITQSFSLDEIGTMFGLEPQQALSHSSSRYIATDKYNLILHPKSQGSAREWGLKNFMRLIQLLDTNKFNILISGTAKDRETLQELFDGAGTRVTDICGLMPLNEFITFISCCDGLVANSTGPLHIAAALGKEAIGIYPPMRPIHPGRWAPLGVQAEALVLEKECSDCKKYPQACHCIMSIEPALVAAILNKSSERKLTTINK